MKKVYSLALSFLTVTAANAGTLELKVTSAGTSRDCGKITQVINSNSDSVLIVSQSCTCDLRKSMSVSDTMELVRSNERLKFICEASSLSPADAASYNIGRSASMTTSYFSIQTVAQ